MTPEFDIQITEKDLFRFNMRKCYTAKIDGPLSLVIAIAAIVFSVYSFRTEQELYGILCAAGALLMIFYNPIALKIQIKATVKLNKALTGKLHYKFDEDKIVVSLGEESTELPYDQVYKFAETKRYILVYTSRVAASILPVDQIGDQYEALKKVASEKIPEYRLKLK